MASPFRFRLEPVRDIRVHAEEQAKERFAASLSQRARGAAMLAEAQQRLDRARGSQACDDGLTPLGGAMLVTRQAFLERLERSRRDAIAGLQQQDEQLRRDRLALAQATQGREVLDQLAVRQRAAHVAEQERAEAAEIDEMASRAFQRRSA